MKRLVAVAITLALLGIVASVGLAAQSANHSVTVQVNAINELALTGGNVTLTISTATAGQQPDSATNSTCTLAWTTNQANRKITAATSLATQNFALKVLAQSVTGGAAAPEVTLSNTAADFVTGVSKSVGGCTLRYTASATAAQGTGSDVHIVTYTLTAG
jgi:hypothetical protein